MTAQLQAGRRLAPALLVAALAGRGLASPGLPFGLASDVPRTLTPSALAAALTNETAGQVSPDGKTLAFGRKAIGLVAVTGPDQDMLSYRIGGRRNPTLVVPRGATLHLLFVNTDDDMFHNTRFGAALKVYPNVMTPALEASVGTPALPHRSAAALHGEELTLRAPTAPGTYAYFCTVRGHAEGGMVGKVVVR